MQFTANEIVTFFLCMTALLLVLAGYILLIIYNGKKTIKRLSDEYEKQLMVARLQIQETTFQTIAHEIHDNISNSLILSKAQLDALDFTRIEEAKLKIRSSSVLIDKSIKDLRYIAQALNHNTI